MAARAIWKGMLRIEQVAARVALYTAATTSERVAFHTLNRRTGHRVHRQFVDAETGKPVERDDQVKGYETEQGETIMLEAEEIAQATPESDKTLTVRHFLPCGEIDTLYLDRPYYMAPADEAAGEAFALLRDGMRKAEVAALAEAVLFRRLRMVLLRPHEEGMIATTLSFDHEVLSDRDAFEEIPVLKLDKEMLDLAGHIINTKKGRFDPSRFDDRYDASLAELVKAKIEGRSIRRRPPAPEGKVVSLMEALRQSAAQKAGSASGRGGGRKKSA